ncbi:P-loop containing nucleoside triphosphate hydrolase protein [Helicostylum pulchrum]|nr:P-loop containing nucleoside triphosphate hydrolase protein [Helicostylum pulchrum]
MSQLSNEDYSKLSLRVPDDKMKFMAMYHDIKEAESRNALETSTRNATLNNTVNRDRNNNDRNNYDPNTNEDEEMDTFIPDEPTTKLDSMDNPFFTNNNESIIPIHSKPLGDTTASKKRPNTSKQSPERNTRRMTTSNAMQRTPPVKQSARDRRLSYLPRQNLNVHRSPLRGGGGGGGSGSGSAATTPATTTTKNNTSPYKQQRPTAKPKMLDEANFVEPVKEVTMERPSSRLLDAYGVPISASRMQQQKSVEVPGSLEAFISKSKAAQLPAAVTTSTTFQNDLHQRIRVCVRKRPLNRKEQEETDIVPVVGPRTIQLNAPKTKIDLTRYTEKHTFTFDDVFDGSSSSEHIYSRTAQPLVEYVFNGGKATCFAHGQTGSGKTYTMLDPKHGLYVLAAQDIFRMLSKPEYANLSASVGFYEIYQGQLYDLLNLKVKLTARDDGNGNIVIAGLREYSIKDVHDLMNVFEYGNQGRTTGKTGANNTSSRSHAVLQVFLKKGPEDKVYGKLSFIDLAGSERGADRGEANTKTRMEGAEINKSLLALKECIRALDQDKKHTPFRGSKLTQVLRDSFIGDSRTCMIATISPNNSNSEHTLNTLRYADRVKQLKGESDPRINNQPTTNVTEVEPIEVENDVDMTSVVSWGEDENLLDVDFPSDVMANALATPTNDRFWPTTTPEDRQEKYMKRLESPPAEVFISNNIMEDPFFSKPVRPPPVDPNMDSTMSNLEISSKKSDNMDVRQIRSFLKVHRSQVKQFEECLAEERKMISKISFTIAHQKEQDEEVSEKTKEDYENYLNDLDEILDRKVGYIDLIRSKIKGELVED